MQQPAIGRLGVDQRLFDPVAELLLAPGKGAELAKAMKTRCEECLTEPGCEQFEIFQSALNPDKLALLEKWSDQAALDAHAKRNAARVATVSADGWR